jgi:hypothetical protein
MERWKYDDKYFGRYMYTRLHAKQDTGNVDKGLL